ncbi:alkaline phosphatase family protein [Pantoea agglomerans]|uniref:alkaline phosphatase family protein n=1 Tax=Enterobacter agglomerans TaxID=549 RepID=UPI003C7B34DD
MIQTLLPDLTRIRPLMRELLAYHASNDKKSVVLLAVDGVRYADAEKNWRSAHHLQRIASVFPTTSSSCWLSALTGTSVAGHGCVGVVFRPDPTAEMINVFSHADGFILEGEQTLFHDAAQHGYLPVALTSDMGHLNCGWRQRLLSGARMIESALHFHAPHRANGAIEIDALINQLHQDIARIATLPVPYFAWIFLDPDRYIHRHGYDSAIHEYLQKLDQLAARWAEKGIMMVAHSDHGLVATEHSPELEHYLHQYLKRKGLTMGGAGRTRWLYVPQQLSTEQIISELSANLPADVEVAKRSDYFPSTEPLAERVGEILLISRSGLFLAEPGIKYEHGSLCRDEWEVPFAIWGDAS